MDNWSLIPGRRRDFFSLCHHIQTRYVPAQPHIQLVLGILSPEVLCDWGVHLLTHLHLLSRLRVQSYVFIPTYIFMVCFIKYRIHCHSVVLR
jgi:hypothetical protein